MSVTDIEQWRRDPYFIYAKYILKLRPLDPIARDPDAATRGTLIHDALKNFIIKFPEKLPDDAYAQLIKTGQETFELAQNHPDIIGHWWPRFVRMADAFVKHESTWRTQTLKIYPEAPGTLVINTSQGEFTLEGRADRIENRTTGWAIIDYKSGTAPTNTKVKNGDAPQLTLMGHMLLNGCFNKALNLNTPPDHLDVLSYWKTGGNTANLQTTIIPDAQTLADEARAGLKTLLHAYSNENTPYTCWPDPENKLRENYEYAHLARIAEWSNADDTEDATI
jgi:ATP-dependent helicase/nuclease subunit B